MTLPGMAPRVLNTCAMTLPGQHQGHQTGVREDVSEVPGDVVVQRAEDPGHLAEALAGQHGPGDHHGDARRYSTRLVTPRAAKADPGEHDPPGDLLPDGVHDLRRFAAFRTKLMAMPVMICTMPSAHGPNQDHQGIIQRA